MGIRIGTSVLVTKREHFPYFDLYGVGGLLPARALIYWDR